MPTSTIPKKKRRRRLIIILIILLRFDVLQLLCEMWEMYVDAVTVEGDLVANALIVTNKVDDLYRLFDANDDPDNFDACAVTDIKPDGFDAAVSALQGAMTTWRGI